MGGGGGGSAFRTECKAVVKVCFSVAHEQIKGALKLYWQSSLIRHKKGSLGDKAASVTPRLGSLRV